MVFVSLQVVRFFCRCVSALAADLYLSRVYIDPYWKRAVRRKHSRFAVRSSWQLFDATMVDRTTLF